jgi:hypothetical protein
VRGASDGQPSLAGILRLSWAGHGWLVWLTCAGAVAAALLGWTVLAVALVLAELVTVGSLIAQLRRRSRDG